MRIDVHTHFVPPRYMELIHDLGGFDEFAALKAIPYVMARGYAGQMFVDGDAAFVEKWIADMNARGVDLIVNSINLQPYFAAKESAVAAARFANEMLNDAVVLGKGRITAFGVLPLPHADAAVDEAVYCLDTLGFVGINMGCSANGRPLDDPAFEPVWAVLNERKAAVYIHPGQTPTMGVGSADFSLGMTFASPTELALAICRLVLSKLTLKYPDIRIISAGFGGSIPYLADRLCAHVELMFPDLYHELNGIIPHLRRFWYDTGYEDLHVYQSFRRTVGVDRIVLGSDSPRMPISRTVDQIETSEYLSAEEKKQILDCGGGEALGLLAPVAT